MDLRNDDWMQIRLFAHTGGADWSPSASDAKVVVFELDPRQGWIRLHGARDAAGLPRTEAVAADAAEVPSPAPSPVPPALQAGAGDETETFEVMT